MFDRQLALEIGYDDQFKWEKTLWYELLRKGKGAVMEEALYFTRWRIRSVSRGQNEYPANMSYDFQVKYDPENAQKPKRNSTNKIEIKSEKKCVYFYSTAGDFRAARTTAFKVWRQFPFHFETFKLIVSSLGFRRPKEISGPVGVTLYP